MVESILTWDWKVLAYIQVRLPPLVQQGFVEMTDWYKHWSFWVVVSLWLLILARRRYFWFLAFATIWVSVGDFFGNTIKHGIQRSRPSQEEAVNWKVKIQCPASGYSFPSLHTLNMRGAGVLLGYKFSSLGLFLNAIAGVAGFSRLVCGVHFPTDVIGGWVLGWIWGLMGIRMWQKLVDFRNQLIK